jgi:AdoMet-dependent heme synthase
VLEVNILNYPLYYLTWNVTNKCNLRCEFCYNKNNFSDNEIEASLYKKFLYEAKKLGTEYILLTGGEPLLRSDLFDIVEYIKSINIKIFLATNGYYLNDSVISKLKGVVSKFNISLDSIIPSKHDKLRGVSGAFDNAIMAINKVKACGMSVSISFTLTDSNYNELIGVADYANENNIPITVKRCINFPTYYGLDKKIFYKAIDIVKRYPGKIIFKDPISSIYLNNSVGKLGGCMAGIYILSITSSGEVQICTKVKKSFGNIRYNSLTDIWNESELLKKIRKREYDGKCNDCLQKSECGGCRAAAYEYYEDIFQTDPFCMI